MRSGSTAKVLLKCKLKYYRISECSLDMKQGPEASLAWDCRVLLIHASHERTSRPL